MQLHQFATTTGAGRSEPPSAGRRQASDWMGNVRARLVSCGSSTPCSRSGSRPEGEVRSATEVSPQAPARRHSPKGPSKSVGCAPTASGSIQDSPSTATGLRDRTGQLSADRQGKGVRRLRPTPLISCLRGKNHESGCCAEDLRVGEFPQLASADRSPWNVFFFADHGAGVSTL